ncbi:NAC domain-containing protein 86-like [Mercurialis annua]|uniref:NAC domain-containing protein 86-like n=1 Tax=Mercurialis annua TaxID=3986 RepID=UPI00215EF922|nr:NAC domain-containing protein 86-like [Mercurialis annua]XP_050229633.1 NAC domain-containing protein 86-like [Mercurialis annua]
MEEFCENSQLEEVDLPSGYKFKPTSVELVVYYLKRKIMGVLGDKLQANTIPTTDVYACNPQHLPFDLFTHGKPDIWFFFSKRRKGKILTSDGYYDLVPCDREAIYEETYNDGSRKRKLVGFMRKLHYHDGKPPKGVQSRWVVEEFRVNPGTIDGEEDDYATRQKVANLVICKVIYNNPSPPEDEEWYEMPDVDICEYDDFENGMIDEEE